MHRRSNSGRRETGDSLDGVLLVDKPSGPTSHDIVDCVRELFKLEKVGHGGTLDPMATGLLIILLGRGTKLSNYVMGSDKSYEGVMHLGVSTDSQDLDGKILSQKPVVGVTREMIQAEMAKKVGDLLQTPPMVSAVKQHGVPLYKLARKGQTVEREPKLIHLFEFNLLDFAAPFVWFYLRCSKGTYVRTLCSDIGEALGCGAHLKQLRRTQSGSFHIDKAVPLEKLVDLNKSDLASLLIPIHQLNIRNLN